MQSTECAKFEHFVAMSHGRTRYFEAGTGEPCILLHGVNFTAGGTNWLPVLEQLARTVRVIAPDFLGWGPGDRLDQGYSFAYLVDFVRELQDKLDLRTSHIVGHSIGGWIASRGALVSYRKILAHMNNSETRLRHNTRRRLPFISAPTFVVWGEQDSVNDIELGRETARLIPNAEMASLPCGHFPATENPREFAIAVSDFLMAADSS